MNKITIRIDNEPEYISCDDLFESMSGIKERFEQDYVILGNTDYTEYTEAAWYETAYDLLKDIDADRETAGDVLTDYTDEQAKAILKIYDTCFCIDHLGTIVNVANVIYPGKEYEIHTIRGNTQSEWNYVACEKALSDTIRSLADRYFGNLSVITCEICDETKDDDYESYCTYVITDTELWEIEHSGNLRQAMIDIFDLDPADDIEILKSNGYIQVKQWKQA